MSDITVDIKGDDSTLKEALADAVGSIKNMADSIDGIGAELKRTGDAAEKGANFAGLHLAFDVLKSAASALGSALGEVADYLKEGINSALAFEVQSTKIGAVLKASSNAAGIYKAELLNLAESLARVTRFNEDSIRSAEIALLTFQNVKGDNFVRAIKLATDLAEVMGTDVTNAAFTLGKALEDPETGMMMLRRAGIILSDAEKALIKSFTDVGDAASAQSALLDIISKKVGGVAEEVGKTASGQWTIFKHKLEEVNESIGKTFIPLIEIAMPIVDTLATAVEGLTEKLTDYITSLKPLGQTLFDAVKPGLLSTLDIVIDFAAGTKTVFSNIGLIIESSHVSIALSLTGLYEDAKAILTGNGLPRILEISAQSFLEWGKFLEDNFGLIIDNTTTAWTMIKEIFTKDPADRNQALHFKDAMPKLELNVDDFAKDFRRERTQAEKILDEELKALADKLQEKGNEDNANLRALLDDLMKKKADVVADADKKEARILEDLGLKKKEAKDKAKKEEKENDDTGDSVGLEELAKRISAAAAKARNAIAGGGGFADALKGAQLAAGAAGAAIAAGKNRGGIDIMGVKGLADLANLNPNINRQGAFAAGPNNKQAELDAAMQRADMQQKTRDEKGQVILMQIADNTKKFGGLA